MGGGVTAHPGNPAAVTNVKTQMLRRREDRPGLTSHYSSDQIDDIHMSVLETSKRLLHSRTTKHTT
ncbi:rCG52179 [Rattus norvegicus]|uniref:RCG52179 n=1 Tax=Rattus norvegicus TaxID=10116 RepID=A6K6B3_RAT|nr:rCG52179 [Rattus norvegicus]